MLGPWPSKLSSSFTGFSYLTFVLFYFAVDVSAFRSLSLIRSLSIATSLSAVIVFIWWSFFEKSLEELLFHHSMNSCVCVEGVGCEGVRGEAMRGREAHMLFCCALHVYAPAR